MEHDKNREACLTKNKKLINAVTVLFGELEDDYLTQGLEACSLCQLGLDKSTAIYLHCQLKNVHDILKDVTQALLKIETPPNDK